MSWHSESADDYRVPPAWQLTVNLVKDNSVTSGLAFSLSRFLSHEAKPVKSPVLPGRAHTIICETHFLHYRDKVVTTRIQIQFVPDTTSFSLGSTVSVFNLYSSYPLPYSFHSSQLLSYIRSTMVLGKIFRLAVDGIAISAVIAGVKKSTGFA